MKSSRAQAASKGGKASSKRSAAGGEKKSTPRSK
jgi:hypothetical protein